MSEKIKDGTVLYCHYMHLNSARFIRDMPEKGTKWKEWKVESKGRPVLVLFEDEKENFSYQSYWILKLTTVKETAEKNGYFYVGYLFGRDKPSYARLRPEFYPDNLLDQGEKDKINPIVFDDILKCANLLKMEYPGANDQEEKPPR